MKILLLNDDRQSSVASLVWALAGEWQRRGHEVRIITTHRTEESREIVRDGIVVSLPRSYRLSLRHWLCIGSVRMARMLEHEIHAFAPDVVHAHNVHTYLTYDALGIAKKHARTVCITLHDVMSFAYGRLNSELFLESRGREAHVGVAEQWRIAGLQWNPFRNRIIRQALRETPHVVAVSHALQRALDQNGIHGVEVVHNGMDLAAWASRPRTEYDGRKVILFGGRLSEDKGTTPLLHALQRVRKTVPEVLLLVLGDASRWNGLVEAAHLSEDLSSHIRCLGWLPREELIHQYFQADLVTTPSLCLDTFNLMNIEAMAASKPVVGTIFGGTPEVIEHGKTGFVCDPRDTETYAGHLESLLVNPTLAEAMGVAGRRRVESTFTVTQMANGYEKLWGLQ